MQTLHHVVIVGGGFAGLAIAKALKRAPIKITLLDRHNYHLFQPLLYQVATGGLSPANIAAPLRMVLKRQRNTQVLLAEVVDIDVAGKRIILSDGELSFDTLIVATGASHHYYGHEEWVEYAPGLKTIDDATEIRRRILLAFEAAEREKDADRRRALMNFVVVGAGPTGVELAGALAEIARDTLKHDFRDIDPSDAHIFLIEGADRVLPPYPSDLSAAAYLSLERRGVKVKTHTVVSDISADAVTVKSDDQTEIIPAHTVLWAAGVKASPLGKVLEQKAGAQLDTAGRVIVNADLSLPGHPDVFVVGDLAHFKHGTERPLPGVAQVALQEGRYVAKLIKTRISGEKELPAFQYRDLGSMATIGRASAIAQIGRLHLTGFFAWIAWLFVHLMYIVQMENRVLVLLQWAWNYLTRNRSARLITGESPFPLQGVKEK